MLKITFIGHQGWMFSDESGENILVDPVLVEQFGHGGIIGSVFPPRDIALDRLPPLSALILTHEHEDHFNLTTIAALDRAVPIFLSERSSTAAESILRQMGFLVHRFCSGECLNFGDLRIQFFGLNHVQANHADEWDVMPFLVEANGGPGFFSYVDAVPTTALLRRVAQAASQSLIFCFTNSFTDFGFAQAGIVVEPTPTPLRVRHAVAALIEKLVAARLTVAAFVAAGEGYCFHDDRINGWAFPVGNEELRPYFEEAAPGIPFFSPLPGSVLEASSDSVQNAASSADFVRTKAVSFWPVRGGASLQPLLDDFGPASGSRSIDVSEGIALLTASLKEFAEHIFGRRLFRGLYSLSPQESDGRGRKFALVLRLDEGFRVFEYDPNGCRFVESGSEEPATDFVAGVDCWMSDWIAAYRGDIAPSGMLFGRSRAWSFAPQHVPWPAEELWFFFSPLRRPEAALELYRRLIANA